MKKYMKIKEFSQMSKTSIRTLQYYDEIDILKPAFSDDSGHRYYDTNSFETLYIINILKSLGLKLREIKDFLNSSDFNILDFIKNEKSKTLLEITNLQSKYMFLNSISFKNNIPLINDISLIYDEIDIDSQNTLFMEWNTFIKNLNSIVKDPSLLNSDTAKNVAMFWHYQVLSNKENVNIGSIESYYSKMGDYVNSYGIDETNYTILKVIYSNYKDTLD